MEIKKIVSIIFNVILVLLVLLAFIKYYKTKDIGKYDFCVEWNYNIYREDLLWKCFDFNNMEKICDWYIDDNRLVVFDYYNKSDYLVYDCTKLVKSIDIEIVPKIEELKI